MTDALFVLEGERFVGTELSGSPWGDDLVHGGPANALLAHAIERFAAGPEMRVARLTVDLFRPVPKAPLAVSVRSVRAGRRIHAVEASLLADDVEVSRASGLLLRRADHPLPVCAPDVTPPGPEGIETRFLGRAPRTERPARVGFFTAVEARWVTAPGADAPPTVWLRAPMPLAAGEPLSPLVNAAAVCDFVNAISGGAGRPGERVGFINTDNTIYLMREPASEWICLQVERAVDPSGLGVTTARVYDTAGLLGHVAQAVLANRFPGE